MKSFIWSILSCLVLIGCTKDSNISNNAPSQSKLDIIQRNGVITSFGDDKVIYIDENNIATIISKSGDVLSRTNIQTSEPIENSYNWKSRIPHNINDTLYATARFIDDVIYYKYYIKNGKNYGVKPYLMVDFVKVLDLPCQSGWIGDIDDKKYFSCSGKVNASLSIWKEVVNEWSFGTTSTK